MKKRIESIIQKNKLIDDTFNVEFYRLSKEDDKQKLNDLLNTQDCITIHDELHGQLEELVKSQNPKTRFTKESLKESAIKHIGSTPFEEYGVWVYYPWSNKLIHLLDEEEFVYVRTNRNQYKITPEEETLLSSKKIGVIGLSVGQSIALTIAMERSCGELRIADFDILELSNLNRIRTGIHNLGIAKTIAVAREIAEIDPYLKVVCFSEGITEENIDNFIIQNGKLDLLVDECDGLVVKILCRQKAKHYGVPVVMDTSDRGMLDVERFDLEPNRPIFHGFIDHLDINDIKKAKTNEEKVPYILPILGIETLSNRMKASMLEIEQSISTWPQLASSVVLGGGIGADVSRRILLNQFHDSGRYFIDLEDLIANKINNSKVKESIIFQDETIKKLTESEIREIASNLAIPLNEENYSPTKDEINNIVESAIKAPSGGNSQPWKWYYEKGNLFLFHDQILSDSLLDFNHLASYVSFGAATENLFLKSHQIGLNPKVKLFPKKTDKRIVCQYTFLKNKNDSSSFDFNYLVDEIETRLTNRIISERVIINKDNLEQLKNVSSSIYGSQLQVIDDFSEIEKLAEIISKVEKLRIFHKRGHSDFVNEIRWSDYENFEKRDGIDLKTIDLTETEKAGLYVSKKWEVVKNLKNWNKGSAFEKLANKTVLNSSAICLITMPDNSEASYFQAGQAIQRTWLTANKIGISFQPISPATFFFARLIQGKGLELEEQQIEELKSLRKKFETIFNLNSKTQDIFLFRLFIAKQPSTKSIRRKMEDVLVY
jgi:hypothetical protein